VHDVAKSFFKFISVCRFQFFLQMVLAVCRRYAVFLKFWVSSSSVLWAGVLILFNAIFSDLFSLIIVIPKFQFPKSVFMLSCS